MTGHAYLGVHAPAYYRSSLRTLHRYRHRILHCSEDYGRKIIKAGLNQTFHRLLWFIYFTNGLGQNGILMHTHKNIAVSVSEKIWIKCFVNSCCSNTWNVEAYSLTNPRLPRIVTCSSSVGQPRPTASRTGVPVRPRTPTPGPDHRGGLTSFSKCNALLVETDLSK